MINQLRAFITAVMFYTRIPVFFKMEYSKDAAQNATKFLPLVGWIVGGISALIFYGCTFIFPISVCILLSMIASILITGAFHEDGLADVCDGFGGGHTKERKLEIMKDSHIGAYGVTGLIMLLLLKFVLLNEIYFKILPFIIISAHSLSRFAAITIMNAHQYVRRNEESKVIGVIKKMTIPELIFACICGLLPMLLFQNYLYFLLIMPVIISRWLLGIYFKKQIGGYTGDCLGAAQQICEIVFYLSFFVLWKYIL
jgi:adenosylcobinamide-GDP ribazoletransferase